MLLHNLIILIFKYIIYKGVFKTNKIFKENFTILEEENIYPLGDCFFVQDKIKNEFMYIPKNDVKLFDESIFEYFKTLRACDSLSTIEDPAHLYIHVHEGDKILLMD